MQGLLNDVDFELAYRDADSALANGRAAEAIELAKKALALKDDAETAKLLDRAQKRVALDALLETARTAARESRLDDAQRGFEEALPRTSGDERRRVEAELADVKRRMGEAETFRVLAQERQRAIDLARASDWVALAAKASDLERAGDKDAPSSASSRSARGAWCSCPRAPSRTARTRPRATRRSSSARARRRRSTRTSSTPSRYRTRTTSRS